jgi:hypothetical protein
MNVLTITESNISIAWAKGFLELMNSNGGIAHPAVIIINGLSEDKQLEDWTIRTRLDKELKRLQKTRCASVSGTIFPSSMWNPASEHGADLLFERYNKAWPGISKCPANRKGVYFRRLTAFTPKNAKIRPVNQLKFIADTFGRGNHRKSALQAAVFDPTRDHTDNRQKGFPCLQQVAFTPLGNGGMSITGFYATQYQFEKAYGNYLGLYGLGNFIAKQLGLALTEVVCLATVLHLGNCSKSQLKSFEQDIERIVKKLDAT